MKRDNYSGEYILESGRRLSANQGIIGINEDLKVYEGYDGRLGPDELTIEHGFDKPFTGAERMEIALFVSGLWLRWAMGTAIAEDRSSDTRLLDAWEADGNESRAIMREVLGWPEPPTDRATDTPR